MDKIILFIFLIFRLVLNGQEDRVKIAVNIDSIYTNTVFISHLFQKENKSWDSEKELVHVAQYFDTIYYLAQDSLLTESDQQYFDLNFSNPFKIANSDWLDSIGFDDWRRASFQTLKSQGNYLIIRRPTSQTKQSSGFDWDGIINGETRFFNRNLWRRREHDYIPSSFAKETDSVVFIKSSFRKRDKQYHARFFYENPYRANLVIYNNRRYSIGLTDQIEVADELQSVNVRIVGKRKKLKYFQVYTGGYFGDSEKTRLNRSFDRWWLE